MITVNVVLGAHNCTNCRQKVLRYKAVELSVSISVGRRWQLWLVVSVSMIDPPDGSSSPTEDSLRYLLDPMQ